MAGATHPATASQHLEALPVWTKGATSACCGNLGLCMCSCGPLGSLYMYPCVRFRGVAWWKAWTFPCHQLRLRPKSEECTVEATGQPSCSGGAGGMHRTPHALLLWAVSPTSQVFTAGHGAAGTEVERGDPWPEHPLPPGSLEARRQPGSLPEGSPTPSLLLTAEASSQPSPLGAAGGLWHPGQLLSLSVAKGAKVSTPVAETKAPVLGQALGR